MAGLMALPEPQLAALLAGDRAEQTVEAIDRVDLGAELDGIAALGVVAICCHAAAYPPLLRQLGDPPAVLFALGRVETLEVLREEPAVAIVGTRNPSSYGTEVASSLGRGLGAAGVPVVSGLARGIDGTAHRGCLQGSGVPVAVLAGGPDVVYPRRHRALHGDIVRTGMVLSELPPGTSPFRWSFPARNRIMAGLARMTVVVEAADPSGSLITADFAKDLGRSVAAVPGRVTTEVARGTNGLLRDGAVPITGAEDILDEVYGVGMRRAPAAVAREPDDTRLRAVLDAAERTGSVAGIAEETGMATGDVRAALGRLEAEGYLVRRDVGGWQRTLGAS
jgi:DNA processing protein